MEPLPDGNATPRIRLYEPADRKQVQYVLGLCAMEQLGVANKQVYTNPLMLSIWVFLSGIFVQFMGWWPDSDRGWLGYLSPVPAFGCFAVPLLFAVDWYNRPYFEQMLHDTLRQTDLVDIPSYYSSAFGVPSAFWTLEKEGRIIGLIAVDGTINAEQLHVPRLAELGPVSEKANAKNTKLSNSNSAFIRHFWVDEQYRQALIQDDLLRHAMSHSPSSVLQIWVSPLETYKVKSLVQAGFQEDAEAKASTFGVLRWRCRLLRKSGPKFR